MNAFTLHDSTEQGRPRQWLLSAVAIAAAHLCLIAAAVAWYQQALPPGVEMPAIMVDMAPASAAPTPQPQDLAPGPVMQEAHAAPEPVEHVAALQAEQVPVAPKPDVVLPLQPKPEAKPRADRKPDDKRKPERAEPKPLQLSAPHTTAPPKAERQASLASASNAGSATAAAAALPSYRDRVAAHLARFKQYPSAAKSAGEQGTAMLSFTVGRGGQVLGSRLAGSSGHAALDAETLAMIRRAQPLPPFPPEIAQASLSFTVPVRFALR
jgi:periplasmic protein TonB